MHGQSSTCGHMAQRGAPVSNVAQRKFSLLQQMDAVPAAPSQVIWVGRHEPAAAVAAADESARKVKMRWCAVMPESCKLACRAEGARGKRGLSWHRNNGSIPATNRLDPANKLGARLRSCIDMSLHTQGNAPHLRCRHMRLDKAQNVRCPAPGTR